MRSDILLKVEGLCQYFTSRSKEHRAVDNISFDIKRGEVFSLVGESGCGKTTTGRCIIRLYDITAGSVYLDGVRICAGVKGILGQITNLKASYKKGEILLDAYKSRLKELKDELILAKYDRRYGGKEGEVTKKIQMIFQDPIASLNPRMTVREIIAEGLIIRGENRKEAIDSEVYKVLSLVGLLPEHAGRYPHEFSGGQRQRIGIARAIILNPELIIADEPISALDVSIQAQVINLLNGLRKTLNLTVLFIAHDLSVVKYFSDRIAVMYRGKIVELATSCELFARPLHPYTKSLLSAIPQPDPISEKLRKRIVYEVREGDNSLEEAQMREICSGHFVYCNSTEFENYKKVVEGYGK